MTVPQSDWADYVKRLAQINDKAADAVQEYINFTGNLGAELDDLIDYAYMVNNTYGEAAATLACEMYDGMAEALGRQLPPAVPAEVATYDEVAAAVTATGGSPSTTPSAISRLVKRAAADTTLQNARRDRAQFAWIPSGETCAYCLMLASNGWQNQSYEAMKYGHAEHIHANCDCNYAVRFDSSTQYAGYDPDKYKAQFDAAEGRTYEEKILSLRREAYAENAPTIRAQQNAAYAARKERAKANE